MPGYGVNTHEGLIYGQNLSLQGTVFVADPDGQLLPDGMYTWGVLTYLGMVEGFCGDDPRF